MDFSDRYKTPLATIFTRQRKLEYEWQVELALIKGLCDTGKIPAEAYPTLKKIIESGVVTLERTLAIESETHHDIMAMVKAIAEQSPEFGGFVHLGATSQDVNDTVTALQIGESQRMLLEAIRACKEQLTKLAEKHKNVVTIARTHGQHAIPITMGFKFANYLYEMSCAERLMQRVEVPGKFGGAAGTFASLGTQDVQAVIMKELGIQAAPISTQVVSRVHIAEYIFACSSVAAVLERLGKEIRNLQRTEIGETMEGFGANQVGSSTMPQKRNPHKSERVCGLARDIRSALAPALETIGLEHERDLTNSSVERSTIPRASILTHYILLEMTKILTVLEVDLDAVERNLNLMGGKQLSERIMIACAHKLGRQEAHEILRTLTSRTDFVQALRSDPRITSVMTPAELDDILDPHTYIGLAPQIVESIVKNYGVKDSTGPLTYAAAGVSIDAGDSLVEAIKPMARSTRRLGADADLGGFGGLFDLPALKYADPLLVACTDGVGTKLSVAKIAGRHDTIGIDLVAMSVNDLIVQGAEPLLFLDYYACSALDVNEAKQVIAGIASACKDSGCALVGGETAELPGMYHNGDYDLAGFAVGAVERSAVLPRISDLQAGDVLLGVPSSGVHSNGFSLVRRVVSDSGADWHAAAPFESTESRLCDALLIPTKLYVKCSLPAVKTGHVKALAHITGGGLVENIPRVLSSQLTAHVECGSWPMPPVFNWLSGKGRRGSPVADAEMARTFNCGIGLVVVVSAEHVDAVKSLIEQNGEQVHIIGSLKQRQGEEAQVQMNNINQLFNKQ